MSTVLLMLWMGCGTTPPATPAPEVPTAPAAPAAPKVVKPVPIKRMPKVDKHRELRPSNHLGDGVKATFLDMPAERPIDRKVLPLLRKPIEGPITDAVSTAKERVDLFQDEGFDTPNRVEFDFDRDGIVDEKWDVGEHVTRWFMPDAIGTMTVQQVWKDRRWKDVPK